MTHQVHAVVPVACTDQRQSVRADDEAPLDRANAVLVDRADLVADRRLAESLLLAGAEERRRWTGSGTSCFASTDP